MLLLWHVLLALVFGSGIGSAAESRLELRGQVTPPFRWAPVVVQSTGSAFRKETYTNLEGKFRFKKLPPGHYTVHVLHRRWGEVRQSIAVTPSFADAKGRVETRVIFRRSAAEHIRQLRERHMVSVDQLSVAKEARKQYQQATKRLEQNDTESAVNHLEKAVEISPQFAAAWNQLGTIAYHAGEYSKAEGYFREALAIENESFPPTVNLGAVLLALSRFEEALPFNESAVRIRPEDSLANSQLGINYFRLDKNEQAISHLTKARRNDPAHASVPQLTLAQIYAQQGQLKKAIRELEDLKSRHPDSQVAEIAEQALAKIRHAASEQAHSGVAPPAPSAVAAQ
jgi:tetratricopeptide (TPR) repeat protein